MTELRFTVLGHAQPAGSKTRFGKRIVDANPKAKPWQAVVAAAAAEHLDGRPPFTGPLFLQLDFYVVRPAGHYGTGRNRHLVKASAPRFPAVRPDCTKLIRAVEDALTGLAWRDDAQVVTQEASKRYGHPERVEVLVLPIGAGT